MWLCVKLLWNSQGKLGFFGPFTREFSPKGTVLETHSTKQEGTKCQEPVCAVPSFSVLLTQKVRRQTVTQHFPCIRYVLNFSQSTLLFFLRVNQSFNSFCWSSNILRLGLWRSPEDNVWIPDIGTRLCNIEVCGVVGCTKISWSPVRQGLEPQ